MTQATRHHIAELQALLTMHACPSLTRIYGRRWGHVHVLKCPSRTCLLLMHAWQNLPYADVSQQCLSGVPPGCAEGEEVAQSVRCFPFRASASETVQKQARAQLGHSNKA